MLPGQEVTLRHDKKGYAICSPLFGKQRVPAVPTEVVEIRMLPEGSKLFWTPHAPRNSSPRTADESAKQPKDPRGGETDLSSYIHELGRSLRPYPGRDQARDRQVDGGGSQGSNDFRKQAMAASRRRNFAWPGRNFGRSADEERRQAAERFRKSAADRELSGDSYYNALDFRQALKTYQTALKALNVYHDGLEDLGLKVYPEYATDVRKLAFKIANVKADLGEQVAGPDSQRYLEEAIQEYRRQITQIPKISNPQRWAETQNDLGLALRGWASGRGARRGTAAGRGGRGPPPGPRRPHPRRPPPGLGQDPGQPGRASEAGRAAGGRRGGAAAGRGGRRPSARPSPSAPATTSPSSGP